MDLLDTLKNLRRAISDDFYKKLLEGKISDAKNTLRFIRDSMQNIMAEWYLSDLLPALKCGASLNEFN